MKNVFNVAIREFIFKSEEHRCQRSGVKLIARVERSMYLNDICSPRRNPCGEHTRACVVFGDDMGDQQKYRCDCRNGYSGRHCEEFKPPRYEPATPCDQQKEDDCFIPTEDPYEVCVFTPEFVSFNPTVNNLDNGAHSCDLDTSICRPKEDALWDYECVCREGFEDSCVNQCGSVWSQCYQTCAIAVGKGSVFTPVVVE